MMFGSARFVYNGWIEKLYLEPKFFFKFYGFEWIKPLGETGMYLLLALIIASAFMIMVGLFYRLATIIFFSSFAYLELIDATNYLNHYYLVVLLAFLLIFLPANRLFSIDVLLKPKLAFAKVPAWTINILILQLTIVYTCAGIAKLNPDWIFRAMPLAIWLPEHQDIPVLGYFFKYKWVAFAFSWFGAFYDLTIAYFLMINKTRNWAYFFVIVFHLMTYLLFNIGLFPFIMIFSTLIFFPGKYHEKWLNKFTSFNFKNTTFDYNKLSLKILNPLLIAYFLLQIILPFRHVFYPGNPQWTEEGYRFSWRVMLLEKSGQATFRIEDTVNQRKTEIINGQYLTQFQEKQMSIQPDFILQFAHFLKKEYQQRHGIENPIVTVESYVALNGRTSQTLIDPKINLVKIKDNFAPKKWILPFKE